MSNQIKIAIIVAFLGLIIILEILVQNFMNKTIYMFQGKIDELKTVLLEGNYEESKNKSEALKDKWKEYEDKYGYFMDHDEIEKVTNKVTVINENSKNKEYKLALEDSIEAKYILEHIQDKLKFKLSNIF